MAIPKAFQGSVDYNNGSTQAFRGTFNEPGTVTTTVTTKPKRTRTQKPKTVAALTTTTTTQPNTGKKSRKTKKTNKPKRPPTNWTTFTKRVSTLMKNAGRTGGPNAVLLASELKKNNPNVKSITNDEIKTRMTTFTAPPVAKKGSKKATTTTTTTTTVEPEEELQRIIFKQKKYYYDEKTGAAYERNGNTNAKGKYVGIFTPKNSVTGKPKLNTTAPEPGFRPTVLSPIESVAETEYEETNTNNDYNNGNTTSNENETNNETNQEGGSYNPSCGCDLQANWPSASVLPRGGIQGGGGCGCMKWGGKRSTRKQSGGGCPTPDACPFPGTGYCGFYARGGYKATKKNRNAL